jgi:hypothetical protein
MAEDLREQYATDDNLRARIALHAAFSINPHWAEWLFEREVGRVLVSGGAYHASTIGRGHLAELHALVPGYEPRDATPPFGLETGPEQLQPFFADIRVERFKGGLAVTDAEPVLAYLRSSERYCCEDLTGARTTVQKAIARHGAFTIAQRLGAISYRKP